MPVTPDEGLELSKALFYWVEVGRVRRQVQELDAGLFTHVLNYK